MNQHQWSGDEPSVAHDQRPVRGPYDAVADAEHVLWRCQRPHAWRRLLRDTNVIAALIIACTVAWAPVAAFLFFGWRPW